jgi:hypothetical protein
MPSSHVDLITARLVSCFHSSAETGCDIAMQITYICSILQLLASNRALCDATELFLSTWQSQCTGSPPDRLIDPKAHHVALRSLQKALDDPKQQFSRVTLVAATILQKIEVWR